MTFMKEAWKKFKGNSVVIALIYLALGIFMILRSEDAGVLICYVLGGALLIMGALELINGLRKRELGIFYTVYFAIGIVLLCLGLVMILRPYTFIQLMSWIFGGILIISAIADFSYAAEMRRFQFGSWWISIILALLTALMGIILIAYDFKAVLFIYIGVFLIIDGATDLWIIIALSGALKRFEKANPASPEMDEAEEMDTSGDVVDAEEGEDFHDANK